MRLSKRLNTSIKKGDLVEYKDPLPHVKDLFGIVLKISEVSSNVYERGYIEALVMWNKEMWSTEDYRASTNASRTETFEDVVRLRKISN